MKLITITGPSGAGKDTVARLLSDMTGIPLLVSYTTRPMREGEQNGREHWFVTECTTPSLQMLAYTVYGGYEYWTDINQVHGKAIYVIDERGLRDLQSRFPAVEIQSIFVTASKTIRKTRGVSEERIKRDEERVLIPLDEYSYEVDNEGTEQYLLAQLRQIAKRL